MKMSRMMCQHGRTALVAAALLAVSSVQAFTLVGPGAQVRVVVDPNLPDCVLRAAQDLTNDVKKITGADLPLVRGGAVKLGDVHVAVKSDGRWEAYSVREQGGVLEVAGSDARGAMFGVYDFIERYLGVDPMYFWSGVPHPKRAELAWKKVEIVQGEPSFRFRGWFLNDEDLLTKWREASGVRDYSQYRYYHDVVNHGAMEAVAEALVRARMNLIIPASFLNATRPAEEGLAAICAARGVFVSMHHIEPMGVSGYTFKDYWKQRGRDLEYSYFKYPREVEEVWRALATRWAKFPNVVWQIGLRGTGDRPMWADDPTMPKDDAGRARLITAALERQLAILDEVGVPREGRHVTTTLWGEGAYFHAKGLLKIPAGTTVVYSDNNCGWRWQRDLLDAPPPADGERRGVYYHHQLIGMGPHLVSLVPAARTCAMLRGARAKGACDYAIFNMGNVREFVYGIDATAKMTWNIDAFDPEAWTKAWIARRLGSNAAAWNDAVNLHYKSLQLHPETGVPCFLDGLMQSQYRRHVGAVKRLLSGKELRRPLREPFANAFKGKDIADPFHAALSDTYPVFASNRDTYMRLAAQRAGFEQTLRLAQRALAETAPEERPFAEDFVVYPARLMVGLTTARMEGIDAEDALRAGDPDAAAGHLRRAADALRDVIAAGKAYCHGKWADWYRGCEKVSPEAMLAFTEEVLAAFPPICRVASAEEWTRDVRPRVIEFFDANVYGQLPAARPNAASTWCAAPTRAANTRSTCSCTCLPGRGPFRRSCTRTSAATTRSWTTPPCASSTGIPSQASNGSGARGWTARRWRRSSGTGSPSRPSATARSTPTTRPPRATPRPTPCGISSRRSGIRRRFSRIPRGAGAPCACATCWRRCRRSTRGRWRSRGRAAWARTPSRRASTIRALRSSAPTAAARSRSSSCRTSAIRTGSRGRSSRTSRATNCPSRWIRSWRRRRSSPIRRSTRAPSPPASRRARS